MVDSCNFDERLIAEGGMNEIETFYGLVETTADALKIVDLCGQGKLGRVSRRLHEAERKKIRSGSVFVFDEIESGVKRWTDGRVWSPSRILGNFLIYRELERRNSGGEGDDELDAFDESFDMTRYKDGMSPRAAAQNDPDLAGLLPWLTQPVMTEQQPQETPETDEDGLVVLQSKKLLTNHKGDFTFKPGGLIKKTISIKVGGHPHHLICYYNKQDFCYAHLGQGRGADGGGKAEVSPFNGELLAEVRRVKVSEEFLAQQSFRKPVVLNHDDTSLGFTFDPSIVTALPALDPPKGKKRRGSFPGALPASRPKRELGNDPFYFVPIAPAQDSSSPALEGPFMPFQANLQAIPENNLSCLEMMAGMYQPETPTRNSFKDDLAAIASLYPTPPYTNGNGNSDPIHNTENSMKEGLKWNNWFNSSEQDQLKANQEFFQAEASPVIREDPMLAPVRPPSALFGLEDMPNSCD